LLRHAESKVGGYLVIGMSRLRVRGVDRLRVCDLSAMPNINAGNTNAPAMMMGARCAQFMMEARGGGG